MSFSTISNHHFLGLPFLPFAIIFTAKAETFFLLCAQTISVFDFSKVQHQLSLILAHFLLYPSVSCHISFKAFSLRWTSGVDLDLEEILECGARFRAGVKYF